MSTDYNKTYWKKILKSHSKRYNNFFSSFIQGFISQEQRRFCSFRPMNI